MTERAALLVRQVDGTLELPPEDDASPPRLSKRLRADGGDPAALLTASSEPAQGNSGSLPGGGERGTRHGSDPAGLLAERRATEQPLSHGPTPSIAVAPSRTGRGRGLETRSVEATRGGSRLGGGLGGGGGHASARSASVGERRSIQLLLSAVEELHKHDSEPAGGARLTVDESPESDVRAPAADVSGGRPWLLRTPSAAGKIATDAAPSGSQDISPRAEHVSSRGTAAPREHLASAARTGAAPQRDVGGAVLLSEKAPGSSASHMLPGGALLVADSPQAAEAAVPRSGPRRGPLPPVSPFAVVQSSGSSPEMEAAPSEPRPVKVSCRLACSLRLSGTAGPVPCRFCSSVSTAFSSLHPRMQPEKQLNFIRRS